MCYDVGGDLADEVAKANGKEDFQASVDQLHASMEKYCEFYQMSPGTPLRNHVTFVVIKR